MVTYSFEREELDFVRIHQWLTGSYWSVGIGRERVEKGFANSTLCIGAFCAGQQIGVARVVSDTTRFAYVADVFVDEAFRKRGIGREMVRQLMGHPLMSETTMWCLLTLDAHGVYESLGFEKTTHPERFMIWRDKSITQNACP